MPGIRSNIIDWPYREGLRMDEMMNPLTLLTFGLYGEVLPKQNGEVLPKQNGAPVRIVVLWKYGVKSASIFVRHLGHDTSASSDRLEHLDQVTSNVRIILFFLCKFAFFNLDISGSKVGLASHDS